MRDSLRRLLMSVSQEECPALLLTSGSATSLCGFLRTFLARFGSGAFQIVNIRLVFHDMASSGNKTVQACSDPKTLAMFLTGHADTDMAIVRELARVSSAPSVTAASTGRRILVLCNVHVADEMCQFALRKVMERATDTSLFILTARSQASIESALLSRCLVVPCQLVGKAPSSLTTLLTCDDLVSSGDESGLQTASTDKNRLDGRFANDLDTGLSEVSRDLSRDLSRGLEAPEVQERLVKKLLRAVVCGWRQRNAGSTLREHVVHTVLTSKLLGFKSEPEPESEPESDLKPDILSALANYDTTRAVIAPGCRPSGAALPASETAPLQLLLYQILKSVCSVKTRDMS